MLESLPKQEAQEAGVETTKAGTSKEAAESAYQELHAETERLSQAEAAERDAALADIQERIYGGASERAKIASGKRVEIGKENLEETKRVIERAEELRAMGKQNVTFESAKRSLERDALAGQELKLDLKDVAEKTGRAAIKKATEEEIESAVEVPREE